MLVRFLLSNDDSFVVQDGGHDGQEFLVLDALVGWADDGCEVREVTLLELNSPIPTSLGGEGRER